VLRAVCHVTRAENFQSPHRLVRARRHYLVTYYNWLLDHAFLLVLAQAIVGEFLQTFMEYPQRQNAASFNLDEVLRKLHEATRA
jgi:hypothetical protein